ncbi:lipase family protein [Pleionea sp. CnH1-48]|uniref:lipase family protein n=1 Tax=Pleionea sp. CnH1-48 TaxID=2954494 RepID=UPI0020975AE5|nr:lipase family protein [Pleionea sp. CnH1-48]MCO7224920.1 lipase family protein [Pleionea sp. CnH1-48]
MDIQYAPKLSIELALLCEQSYLQYSAYEDSKKWELPKEYRLLETLHAVYEGVHVPIGFIAEKDNQLYITWRGTDNLEEWIQDAKYEQKHYNFFDASIKVELGFGELYNTSKGKTHPSPRATVIDTLKQQKDFKNVYITGHSLGGALAVLNALDVVKNMGHVPIVYTFAGPRVGNPDFVFQYNQSIQNCWRVVNSHDVVPDLPPKSCPPIFHEYHYGHVHYEHRITFGNSWDLPADHSLNNYIAALEKQ